jgi:hypothetical protein
MNADKGNSRPGKPRGAAVAAGGTVTALGTAFDVVLEKTGARVTVTKHRRMACVVEFLTMMPTAKLRHRHRR